MVRTRDWCPRAAFLLLFFFSRRALPKCQAYDDQIQITNASPPPPPNTHTKKTHLKTPFYSSFLIQQTKKWKQILMERKKKKKKGIIHHTPWALGAESLKEQCPFINPSHASTFLLQNSTLLTVFSRFSSAVMEVTFPVASLQHFNIEKV